MSLMWLHRFTSLHPVQKGKGLKMTAHNNQQPCFPPSCEFNLCEKFEYCIKHLRIKHCFHQMCSREQNGHFWGNWRKVLIQMEVAEPGKSLFSSIINYLHYRALGDSGVTNLAIGGACLIFGNGIVRLFWEVIIPNHCDNARAFQNDKNYI